MDVKFILQGDVGIIGIEDKLDASNVQELRNSFPDYLEQSKKIIFDLNKMDFMDSTGLGVLVSCLRQANQDGGDIKVANLQDKPRLLFELTRANKIFEIYDSIDMCKKSF